MRSAAMDSPLRQKGLLVLLKRNGRAAARRWAVTSMLTIGILAASTAGASASGLIRTFSVDPQLTAAGAHGDLTVTIDQERDGGGTQPGGLMRSVALDLPPGMIGNPQLPVCSLASLRTNGGGWCPEQTQVGVAQFEFIQPWGSIPYTSPVYNVERRPGTLARLAFSVQGFSTPTVDFRVREEGDYGVTATIDALPSVLTIAGAKITLWGVPADPSHDDMRVTEADRDGGGVYFQCIGPDGPTGGSCPSSAPRRPFLTNPTRCDVASTFGVRLDSWQDPNVFSTATSDPVTYTGCEAVPFAPTLDVQSETPDAGAPTGVDVDLAVPRVGDDDPDGRSAGAMRTVSATLPEGMAISPSAADGLGACTDEQLGIGTRNDPQCPDSAKVGTVTVDSPIVDEPLTGSLYIGNQRSSDPESGDMYRLLVVAEGDGARVKLRGSIKADPRTGQLTTTFVDNPDLPFDRLRLHLSGGDRAALSNPPTCGTHTTRYTISSWSGATVSGSDDFTVDRNCGTERFAPALEAGTLDPAAGRFSPLTMTIRRDDRDQQLAGLAVQLPPGLLANVGSVPLCPEAQAQAGTCGPDSRVGSTTIAAGPGARPYALGGTVHLGGPYKGAPFSLTIVVDAKAGPFDLGRVVVRSPLTVDANRATAGAPADPLPTILGGVPLKIRTIGITLDRPGFTFNATDCTRRAIEARLTSTGGAVAYASSPYQASGCANLPLAPKMEMRFTGGSAQMKSLSNPGLVVNMSQSSGQSGLRSVRATLPAGVGLDVRHTGKDRLCSEAQMGQRSCPAASLVGTVEAETTALSEPLKGAIYLLDHTKVGPDGRVNSALPYLYLKLDGQGVPLDLVGETSFASTQGQLTATFNAIPDAPIRRLRLAIDAGERGILRANSPVCPASKGTRVVYSGQNGARRTQTLHVTAPDCRPQIAKATVGPTTASVRVSGIGPGRLSVAGGQVRTTRRTVRLSDAATVKAPLTPATRRALARRGTVEVRLMVQYRPTTGKATTLRKTMTVRRKG